MKKLLIALLIAVLLNVSYRSAGSCIVPPAPTPWDPQRNAKIAANAQMLKMCQTFQQLSTGKWHPVLIPI